MISPEIRNQIVDTLQSKYGVWSGFDEAAFVEDETAYKRKIIEDVQPLLAQERLQELLDASQYAEFIELLRKAAQKSVNLLYLGTPKSGDLRILNRLTGSELPSFCRAFFDLLYGAGSAPERLGRFVDYLHEAGLPSYWTFPTYYLFVTDPANNIFVKPRTIQPFLKSIKAGDLWSGAPTDQAYEAIISLAQELRESLSDYGPQDMVDIQSVMYVCGNAQKAVNSGDASSLDLAFPFSRIFKSYADALAAFDLLRLAFEYLGVGDENDERIALTVPKSKGKRALRLNFGMWVVLTFYGPDSPYGYSFEVNMKEGAAGLKSAGPVFKQRPTEPQVSAYMLPVAELDHFRQTSSEDFEEGLRYLGERFADWSRSPYRHAHLAAAASAVFHPEQRQALLTGGIAELPALLDEDELSPVYSLEQLAADTGFAVETLAMWVDAVERKGQAILYGPPGTGKTFLAERMAQHLIGGGDGFMDTVQFHPAYAYEDFMQGIRPRPSLSGGLEYPIVNGRFLDFCDRAADCTGPCVLIIDEINRANLARVFGELMYLLEYRHKEIPLAAGGQRFKIPGNVLILGTMNTADRSIALVDHALRRRFAFLEIRPNYDVLRQYLAAHVPAFPREQLVNELRLLNQRIADRHYEVGISYFMTQAIATKLKEIWCMEILPYLDEYFFDQPGVAAEYEWERIRHKFPL